MAITWQQAITGVLLFAFVIDGISRLNENGHNEWELSKMSYTPMCQYNVVWGHEFSGTTEFVCGNNGFVYHGGKKAARVFILQYLQQQHISQAILLNDVLLPKEVVLEELALAQVNYTIVPSTLGEIIEIK
jgi:hypothetical protein